MRNLIKSGKRASVTLSRVLGCLLSLVYEIYAKTTTQTVLVRECISPSRLTVLYFMRTISSNILSFFVTQNILLYCPCALQVLQVLQLELSKLSFSLSLTDKTQSIEGTALVRASFH